MFGEGLVIMVIDVESLSEMGFGMNFIMLIDLIDKLVNKFVDKVFYKS